MLLPYLKDWIFVTPSGKLLAPNMRTVPLEPLQRSILKRVIEGAGDVDNLGRMFPTAWEADPQRVRASVLSFLQQLNCINIAKIELPEHVNAVIIDRGWGGVYQHAVDLWRALNRHHQVLLIAPHDPMYGFPKEFARLLITAQRLGLERISLVSTINLARAILRKVSFDLLLFTHRIMTPYFFDIVRSCPTIIYGDEHAEGCLRVGECLEPEARTEVADTLQELYYGTPESWESLMHSKALYWSFKHATENWFWSDNQCANASREFPEFVNRFHVVLPPIDTETFTPAPTDVKEPWILFTTTAEPSKVGMKGLTPLLQVFDRIPDAKLRLVLHDARCLPPEANAIRDRSELLVNVAKEQMLSIYRNSMVNCRISRDDSSPVSILETMSCGVPVIVSPVVAKNIPIIADGVTGFVVEPDDLDGIEQKLKFLLNYPQQRNRMGAEAREAVLRHSLLNNLDRITKYFRAESTEQRPSTVI